MGHFLKSVESPPPSELDGGGHRRLPGRREALPDAAAVGLCDERDKGAEREAAVPDQLRLLRLPGRGAEGRRVHQRGHAGAQFNSFVEISTDFSIDFSTEFPVLQGVPHY